MKISPYKSILPPLSMAALRTRRPIRPKPLIPTLTILSLWMLNDEWNKVSQRSISGSKNRKNYTEVTFKNYSADLFLSYCLPRLKGPIKVSKLSPTKLVEKFFVAKGQMTHVFENQKIQIITQIRKNHITK